MLGLGCGGAPPAPTAGRAQVWGEIRGEPKQGAPEAPGRYARGAVPEGATFVDYTHIGPVVVRLEGAPAVKAAPTTVTLSPAGFDDALYAVGVGGQVVVRNQAGRALTVYGLMDGRAAFEVALASGADSPPLPAPDAAGALQLFTYEDEALRADLIVVAGRFQRAQGGARFVFDDLPPGTYTLTAWHARFPELRRPVTLRAGEQAHVDLVFGVNALPKVDR
jgi:hypothetical protein